MIIRTTFVIFICCILYNVDAELEFDDNGNLISDGLDFQVEAEKVIQQKDNNPKPSEPASSPVKADPVPEPTPVKNADIPESAAVKSESPNEPESAPVKNAESVTTPTSNQTNPEAAPVKANGLDATLKLKATPVKEGQEDYVERVDTSDVPSKSSESKVLEKVQNGTQNPLPEGII